MESRLPGASDEIAKERIRNTIESKAEFHYLAPQMRDNHWFNAASEIAKIYSKLPPLEYHQWVNYVITLSALEKSKDMRRDVFSPHLHNIITHSESKDLNVAESACMLLVDCIQHNFNNDACRSIIKFLSRPDIAGTASYSNVYVHFEKTFTQPATLSSIEIDATNWLKIKALLEKHRYAGPLLDVCIIKAIDALYNNSDMGFDPDDPYDRFSIYRIHELIKPMQAKVIKTYSLELKEDEERKIISKSAWNLALQYYLKNHVKTYKDSTLYYDRYSKKKFSRAESIRDLFQYITHCRAALFLDELFPSRKQTLEKIYQQGKTPESYAQDLNQLNLWLYHWQNVDLKTYQADKEKDEPLKIKFLYDAIMDFNKAAEVFSALNDSLPSECKLTDLPHIGMISSFKHFTSKYNTILESSHELSSASHYFIGMYFSDVNKLNHLRKAYQEAVLFQQESKEEKTSAHALENKVKCCKALITELFNEGTQKSLEEAFDIEPSIDLVINVLKQSNIEDSLKKQFIDKSINELNKIMDCAQWVKEWKKIYTALSDNLHITPSDPLNQKMNELILQRTLIWGPQFKTKYGFNNISTSESKDISITLSKIYLEKEQKEIELRLMKNQVKLNNLHAIIYLARLAKDNAQKAALYTTALVLLNQGNFIKQHNFAPYIVPALTSEAISALSHFSKIDPGYLAFSDRRAKTIADWVLLNPAGLNDRLRIGKTKAQTPEQLTYIKEMEPFGWAYTSIPAPESIDSSASSSLTPPPPAEAPHPPEPTIPFSTTSSTSSPSTPAHDDKTESKLPLSEKLESSSLLEQEDDEPGATITERSLVPARKLSFFDSKSTLPDYKLSDLFTLATQAMSNEKELYQLAKLAETNPNAINLLVMISQNKEAKTQLLALSCYIKLVTGSSLEKVNTCFELTRAALSPTQPSTSSGLRSTR